MFDEETMAIAEIVKATPDAIGDYYDFPMKLFSDLATEAAKRGISHSALERGVSQLPTQGLAMVYFSPRGAILGLIPTRMFENIFS